MLTPAEGANTPQLAALQIVHIIICPYWKYVNSGSFYLNIIQAFRENVIETSENHENKQRKKKKKKKIVKNLHINIHFSIRIWYNQTTQYSVLF